MKLAIGFMAIVLAVGVGGGMVWWTGKSRGKPPEAAAPAESGPAAAPAESNKPPTMMSGSKSYALPVREETIQDAFDKVRGGQTPAEGVLPASPEPEPQP